jgi:hypothetical protein
MSKFNSLSPLRKWVINNKFFIKTNAPKEEKVGSTHYLLDGGIWKIPKGEYNEFLRLLSADLLNGEKHYISENRTPIFKFIMDLDFYETEQISINQVEVVVKEIQKVIFEYFGTTYGVIICGSDSKTVIKDSVEYIKSGFHLVWPKIWLTVETAKAIRNIVIENLITKFEERDSINTWADVVDLAVYEDNGLRMVGCRKMGFCKSCKNKKDFKTDCLTCSGTGKVDENRVYSPRSVLNFVNDKSYLITLKSDLYVQLLETSIYNYADLPETTLLKELVLKESKALKNKKVFDSKQDESMVKIENFIKKNFKEHYPKIRIKKLTKDPSEQKYYAEPYENFCMNVNRCHSSSSIYFQLSPNGISQRCYCRKETTEGRISGPCGSYSSKPIPLSRPLMTFLFGSSVKGKKITNLTIIRNSSTSTLDLGFTPEGKKLFSNKEIILENCKSILNQLEKELTA